MPAIAYQNSISTDVVKEKIMQGCPVVPLIHLRYWNYSGRYFGNVLHWVVVNGWKVDNGKLYFHTSDPYRNINTGWYNVNQGQVKNSAGTGYYSGYNIYKANSSQGSVVVFGNPISAVQNAK